MEAKVIFTMTTTIGQGSRILTIAGNGSPDEAPAGSRLRSARKRYLVICQFSRRNVLTME